MAKVIGEALEQFELGVDLVEVFRPTDLVRVFQQVFRVDEDVGAHAITYGDFRLSSDDVLVLESLEAVQQGQQSFLEDVLAVTIINRREYNQHGEKGPES